MMARWSGEVQDIDGRETCLVLIYLRNVTSDMSKFWKEQTLSFSSDAKVDFSAFPIESTKIVLVN